MNAFANSSAIRRLVYLLLSIGLAIYIAKHFAFQNQQIWLIVATLFFSSYLLGSTFLQFITLIFFSGLCGAISVGIFSYLIGWPVFWIIAFSLLFFSLILIANQYPRYTLSCMTISILSLLTYDAMPLAHTAIIARVSYVFGAACLTILSALTLLPYFLQQSVQAAIKNYLWHLQKLNNEIFACFLQPTYADELYLYERRLNLEKQQLNNILKYLTRLMSYIKNPQQQTHLNDCLNHLQNIYAALISVSQLRWQISDHNIFTICSDELKLIQKSINILLAGSEDVSILENAIQGFESNFQKILQITEREPVVFLFFINNMQSLVKQFMDKKCNI